MLFPVIVNAQISNMLIDQPANVSVTMSSCRTKERLFLSLIEFLDHSSIEHVVVGNINDYPHSIDSDIDIIVSTPDSYNIPNKLYDFCVSNDITIVQVLKHEQTAWYFVLAWFDEQGNPYFLQLDVCSNYFRNGKPFLSSKELLISRQKTVDKSGKHGGFYTAAPAQEFIYYLLKKIDKQKLDERQGTHLYMEFNKDPDAALSQINRFWQGDNAAHLIRAARNNDWRDVVRMLPALRKNLHKNLAMSFKSWWFELLRLTSRVFQPTGVFVAFLGPDGAGKSTVMARVEQELAPAFRRSKRYHLQPRLMRNRKDNSAVTEPHLKPLRGLTLSIVKLLYLLADYFFGYVTDILPRLVRSTFVLFDRYYHDLLVDSKRYRYSAPLWIARLIGKFVPKPDLWILLDAPPEVLQSRKQEVSYEETTRQRDTYLRIISKMPSYAIVNTSKPIENVITDVERIVLNFMAKRTAQRLNIEFCSLK
jgi:thymidylate kinase